MPRKKKRAPVAAIVPPTEKVDDGSQMLVNKLSVKDARHLMQTEGELAGTQVAIQLVSIAVVAAACAYAIWVGKATAWHLILPMVAEYLALLVGIVVAFVIVRHKDMRKEARNAFFVLNGIGVVVAASVAFRAHREGIPWTAQLEQNTRELWAWISDYHMQWAMLAAVVSVFLDLPVRVKNLLNYGPPFMAVGLGCGLRAAILLMGIFIFPIIVKGTATSNAWILWGMIIIAESLALWLHWDVQRRLRKLDSSAVGKNANN